MKISRKIADKEGLTIIEVLIASVTFMIGFSIMIFLLGRIIGDYSLKERIIANNLAQKHMEVTLASHDFQDTIMVVDVSNISFEVKRKVHKINNLAQIRIDVIRKKTNRKLVTFYAEQYTR